VVQTAIAGSVQDEVVAALDEQLTRLLARPEVRSAVHEEGRRDVLWPALADAGVFALGVPEADGGLGLDLEVVSGVAAQLGRYLVPGPIVEQTVAPAVLLATCADPVRAALAPAVQGDRVLAVVDPQAVGDAEDAIALRDGRLDGRCDLVRFGADADLLVVVAASDAGPAIVLVDADAYGVTITEEESLEPLTRWASVRFESVAEHHAAAADPATAILLAERLRAVLRVVFAAQLTGIARHLLEESVSYTARREQFGRPIGSFQAVQHILADMCVDVLALEALCEQSAEVGFEGVDHVAALVAKGVASRVVRAVGESALQVHGGIAFTAEFELHRWFLHALALETHYGDAQHAAITLGRALADGEVQPWA